MEEPVFDPAAHLQLEQPDWVTQLPDFSRCDQVITTTGHASKL